MVIHLTPTQLKYSYVKTFSYGRYIFQTIVILMSKFVRQSLLHARVHVGESKNDIKSSRGYKQKMLSDLNSIGTGREKKYKLV